MRKWFVAALFLCFPGLADAAPPIEAYGELPTIRSMALSPDGGHVAYLLYQDGKEMLIVYKFGAGIVGGARTDNVKARSISFAGPDFVILHASETTRFYGYKGRLEYTGAFSYSIDSKKIAQLLGEEDDLYPAQKGIGRIIGVLGEGNDVLMPAFMGRGENPPHSLLKVNLKSGRGVVFSRGPNKAIDWVVSRDGVILAREDYDNKTNNYEVLTKRDGEWRSVLQQNAPIPPYSLFGVKQDGSALIVIDEDSPENFAMARELSFAGVLSPPVFQKPDAEILSILADDNRNVQGAEFTGLYPSYEFYDAELSIAVKAFQAYMHGNAVWLTSWTDDFSKLLFRVEGSNASGDYYLFEPGKKSASPIARARPDITSDEIGQVLTIEYKARDGLTIPALMTMPTSGETMKLPLIVMPHGGPESYDAVGFNWMAQFFASRGYMVLQPNFRGSSGFGAAFRDAGRGEWGGKMQDDITDGVEALIKSGRADPARICIVGASYGGYAALAGGAFTPDLYKCVAAIAPVADLPMMLNDERREFGSDHWLLAYWKNVIGDPKAERERLKDISPANHADAFTAPVLLIHGKDDLVVPIDQSERMERALKAAGKPVEFVKLKGEDHWLSTGETRLETLKTLYAFVSKHIGG